MQFEVILSEAAIQDIFEIYYFVSVNDSFDRADRLRNEILDKCSTLTLFPYRGLKIKEILEERPDIYQIIFKPYNIIYKIDNEQIKILAVLDGRRDLSIIFKERFLS
jgi:toxin ParE1/3/4